MRTVSGCGLLVSLLAVGLSAGGAHAQNYPTKPVRINASGAGTGSDQVARVVAPELAASLGQPVIVENRPPVSLVRDIAKAPPDGYTLLSAGGTVWISPLIGDVPFSVQDFAPISMVTRSTYTLVVHASLPVKSVAELIAYAKARPGALNYSSGSSAGSGSYLAAEVFKSMAGVDVVRIPYKEQARENADVLSGHVHMTFGSGGSWDAQIKAGKLRALATGSATRSLLYPDLPTVADTLPGFVAEQLIGLWAPAKTPAAIVGRLNQDTGRLLGKPEVRERLLQMGQEPVGGTAEQFADVIKGEVGRLTKILKK